MAVDANLKPPGKLKRWLIGGGGFLAFSIAIHALLLIGAAMWVVQTVQAKRKLNFRTSFVGYHISMPFYDNIAFAATFVVDLHRTFQLGTLGGSCDKPLWRHAFIQPTTEKCVHWL